MIKLTNNKEVPVQTSSPSEKDLLAEAKRCLKRGETASAIAAYEKVLALSPRNKKAKKQLSKLRSSTESLTPDPARRKQEFVRLIARLDNKNFEEAIREARRLAVLYPMQPLPLAVEGSALAGIGDHETAVKRFSKAMLIDPEYRQCLNNLGVSLSKLGRWPEAKLCFEQALDSQGKTPLLLRNLGRATVKTGNPGKAVPILMEALALNPAETDTLIALGEAHNSMRNHDEALVYYQKALAIDPESQVITHSINALTGYNSPVAPREYVEKVFDDTAASFETHLLENLQYQMPTALRQSLNEVGYGTTHFPKVLDLGCGTGLSGAAFEDIADELWGIDLSVNMLEIAKRKGIYQHLIHGEISEALSDITSLFDLVICIDVLVYIGDPTHLFTTVRQRVSSGALFLLSTEHMNEGDFRLQTTERYAHSKAFIEKIAQDCGMQLVKFTTDNIRLESGVPVPGGLYIFKMQRDTQ